MGLDVTLPVNDMVKEHGNRTFIIPSIPGRIAYCIYDGDTDLCVIGMSDFDRVRAENLFQQIDENHNGDISYSELENFLEENDVKVETEALESVYEQEKNWDVDNFVAMLLKISKTCKDEIKFKEILSKFLINQNVMEDQIFETIQEETGWS